jgi:hypothetical protein
MIIAFSGCSYDTKKLTKSDYILKNGWVYTTGEISLSSKMPDNTFAYKLTYNVTKGVVQNGDGDLIQGPISQYIYGLTKKVKDGSIKLRYQEDGPIFYEFLEKPKFD